MIRLNKFLSMCGVCSRRGGDKLIDQGRVSVNGAVVKKKGGSVDENHDVVKVDGRQVGLVKCRIHIILNKPRQVVTTLRDDSGRDTVVQFLKGLSDRVYPVGRLDYDTEGVLLLTNDGELAHRLMHPRYQVPRVYEAVVTGDFTRNDAKRIEAGVRLEDAAVGFGRVRIVGSEKRTTRIRLTLTEGHKREVRQLCAAVGHPVKRLRRISYGGITAHRLKAGAWRHLSTTEVNQLMELVGL